MSGGIGPSGDITLPSEDQNHLETANAALKPAGKPSALYTFRQLNALAIAVVLSASGMASVFGESNKLLSLYVAAAAAIGLFLPIAYIFEGVFEGDKEGIKAAAPHVFLLASQVFMEGLAFSGGFSLPIRVFADGRYEGSARRLYVGRALAVANMAFWCFNLFAFLLPVYLPMAFRIYYQSSHNKAN
ncbi:hypothetical protein AAHA92_31548 [Salvia divinorum]|uniref:DUF7733 domain-containing protein n=1 Tax=Salvia divinorum TaxID=28513 RepID=A0ABD1FHT8_SALDI